MHSCAACRVAGDTLIGASAGVQDSGVVSSTKVASDCRQGLGCKLACEVHGDLPGPGHTSSAAAGEELHQGDANPLAGRTLDVGQGAHPWPGGRIKADQYLLRKLRCECSSGERTVGDDANERPL